MVPWEGDHVIRPNVSRSVPGGSSLLWRICSRGIVASIGLASKGFLKLKRNVRVDGMQEFLKILESKRDRSIITGALISECC